MQVNQSESTRKRFQDWAKEQKAREATRGQSGDDKAFPELSAREDYFRFPQVLVDEVMPLIGPNSWAVLCFILRKTLGFRDEATRRRKDHDFIAFSQIMTGVGIAEGATSKALQELQGFRKIAGQWTRDESLPVLIHVDEGVKIGGKKTINLISLNLENFPSAIFAEGFPPSAKIADTKVTASYK